MIDPIDQMEHEMESYNILTSDGFQKDRLIMEMSARELKAIILTSPENVFYVTGYPVLPGSGNPILHTLRNRRPYFVHIDNRGKVSLICWGYSVDGVIVSADEIVRTETSQESLSALIRLLAVHGGSQTRLGVESTMTFAVSKAIADAYPGYRLIVADAAMEELRLIKSEREIEQITRSTETIEQTVTELYSLLRLGMSRLELIREAKYRLLKNGATGISHATFAFGKDNPEIALDEKLEPDHLITLDLGGVFNGYCSDTRRYAFSGEPPGVLLEKYEKMVKVVDSVGAALLPGATYAKVSRRALELYEEHGVAVARRITHVGHHIGIETEEQWIDESEHQIRPGMVINIELYTPADPYGTIGNEETFVIGQSGPRRISRLPRTIRKI